MGSWAVRTSVALLLVAAFAFPSPAQVRVDQGGTGTTANTGASGKIPIGQGNSTFLEKAISGDCTITTGGVMTCPSATSSIIVDLGDDGGNDTTAMSEIATVGANTVFTVVGNKLVITTTAPWPTATALAANGANCSAGQYPLGVDASGAVETCTTDDDTPDSDSEVPDAITLNMGTGSIIGLTANRCLQTSAGGAIEVASAACTTGTSSVTGPGSSTDNAITRWDGTGGTVVQNSLCVVDDSGNLDCSGYLNGTCVSASNNCGVDMEDNSADHAAPGAGRTVVYSVGGEPFVRSGAAGAAKGFCLEDGTNCAAGGSGDITDVFNCASGDCASITVGATDLLDMSGTDASTPTEGLILPQHATLCAGGTAEGQPCWEADANILHIGDGATIKDFVSTAAFSADATVSTTGAVTVAAAIARDAEVPSLETDAAHDTCAEISGCVVGALTAEVNDLEGQDPASILTTEVYIGTGAGTGAFAALSGDATMTNAGVVAVTDDSHNHGTSTIAALDAGDTTTGAFTDARVDGSLEADEVNPTLGTQTVGNYMVDVTAGVGIATTHTPAEGSNATVALSYASTLAGNPAFNAKECVFSTENGSGGFICEGTTAANTNEQLYLFPASDGVDTTNYLTLANSTGAALTTVAADDGGDTTLNLALVADATGDKATLTDTALTYNGTTDVLTATLSGGASSVATSPAADDNDTSLATSAYVQTELNAAGGRSVTCASGSCDADTELYTETKCINIEFPISTDDLLFYRTPSAITIQTINCLAVAGTSAIITLNECDTAGATCAGVDGATTITCNTTASADDGALSNAAGDATDVYRIDVGTVTGSVSQLMVCMTYQVAD